jgi:hypothetical protein
VIAGRVNTAASATDVALRKKYARVYTPQEFGAAANGSTDDTAAFQAAINAARGSAPSGSPVTSVQATGSVYVPEGTYRITAPLEVTGVRGLVFTGAGKQVATILVDAAITSALKLVGESVR